jgi:nucleoside-diphosphate-sugar epimerase
LQASGDIGSETTALALEDGHEVIAFDLTTPDNISELEKSQPKFRYTQGDAQVFESVIQAMRESGCDGVVNLAAIRNPSDYLVKSHNTNVVISWNILRAAAEVSSCQAQTSQRRTDIRT